MLRREERLHGGAKKHDDGKEGNAGQVQIKPVLHDCGVEFTTVLSK